MTQGYSVALESSGPVKFSRPLVIFRSKMQQCMELFQGPAPSGHQLTLACIALSPLCGRLGDVVGLPTGVPSGVLPNCKR